MAARRVKENTGEDRISELPDSILHHIFTLVPTIDGGKDEHSFQALETCVVFDNPGVKFF